QQRVHRRNLQHPADIRREKESSETEKERRAKPAEAAEDGELTTLRPKKTCHTDDSATAVSAAPASRASAAALARSSHTLCCGSGPPACQGSRSGCGRLRSSCARRGNKPCHATRARACNCCTRHADARMRARVPAGRSVGAPRWMRACGAAEPFA